MGLLGHNPIVSQEAYVDIYVTNRDSIYMKQKLTKLKREINNSTTILEDFKFSLVIMYKKVGKR